MIGSRALRLTEADLYIAEGEHAKAKPILKSILDDYSADVETLYKLATVLAKLNELDDARARIERVLVFAPAHTDSLILQAKLKAVVAPAADRVIPNEWRIALFGVVAAVAAILVFVVLGADVRGSDYEKQTLCGIPVLTASPTPTLEPTAPTSVPATSGEADNATKTSITPLPSIGFSCDDIHAFSVTITDKNSSTPDEIPLTYITLITLFLIAAVVILMYPSLTSAKFADVTLDFKPDTGATQHPVV